VWQILAKDLRLGPRSPLFLWALLLPVLVTLLLRGVFGGLLSPQPRLAIVDQGDSAMTTQARAADELAVTSLDDPAALRRDVELGRYDAGLVLPEGFDEAVAAGARPQLQLWIAGESLAANRAILIGAILGMARELTGDAPPVDVEVVQLGDAGLPLDVRLIPMVVILAVAIAGAMVPASSLVEEKERRTLLAVLVSPASTREVLLAKGALGWLLAMVAGVMTLLLNGALADGAATTLTAVALGALMMCQIGLLLGAWAPDTNTLFAAWKAGALLLLYPVVVFLWPGLPQWVGFFSPTYYVMRPVYSAAVEGAGFGDVAVFLVVAALICAALVPAVDRMGRWLERRLAAGAVSRRSKKAPATAASA